MLIVGYPGSGKTGSLVSLINAGYKIRVLDFDGNIEPILQYADPAMLGNVDIVHLDDKLRMGAKLVETVGIPEAFAKGLRLLDEWKYTDDDGEEVNLGRSRDWGCDTVVVLDALTSMGEASKRRIMNMLNKTILSGTQQMWGASMAEQKAFIERLTSPHNHHHVIVMAHLKIIAPKDTLKDDSDIAKKLKEEISEMVPTRLFPRALGYELPQEIGGEFPTLIEAKVAYKGKEAKRILNFTPRPELDLKLPSPNLKGDLDISTGLLQIFNEIAPPLSECLVPTQEGTK